MDLTRELVDERAAAYADEEPLYAVEAEQLEGLPAAFATGAFGWRDAEWVVRWCFRRHLGAYPDERRRAVEDAFGENDYEAVSAAIGRAAEGASVEERVAALTALEGVDVTVAAAFLQFIDPDHFVVVGAPEWTALVEAGELDASPPESLTEADYARYLAVVRAVADRLDRDLITVQRACWRLGRAA